MKFSELIPSSFFYLVEQPNLLFWYDSERKVHWLAVPGGPGLPALLDTLLVPDREVKAVTTTSLWRDLREAQERLTKVKRALEGCRQALETLRDLHNL